MSNAEPDIHQCPMSNAEPFNIYVGRASLRGLSSYRILSPRPYRSFLSRVLNSTEIRLPDPDSTRVVQEININKDRA